MGLYIPKIKIPKEGYCEIDITIVSKDGKGLHVWQTLDDEEAKALGAEEDETYARIIGKAIEIPTPHGRLIDADALIKSLEVDPVECPGCPEPEFLGELIEALREAPTAIEAEEE